MMTILDAKLPIVPIVISDVTGASETRIISCYSQIRTNGVEHYRSIIQEFNIDMSELYLTYCKRLITVINSMLDGDKNAYSRRKNNQCQRH